MANALVPLSAKDIPIQSTNALDCLVKTEKYPWMLKG